MLQRTSPIRGLVEQLTSGQHSVHPIVHVVEAHSPGNELHSIYTPGDQWMHFLFSPEDATLSTILQGHLARAYAVATQALQETPPYVMVNTLNKTINTTSANDRLLQTCSESDYSLYVVTGNRRIQYSPEQLCELLADLTITAMNHGDLPY